MRGKNDAMNGPTSASRQRSYALLALSRKIKVGCRQMPHSKSHLERCQGMIQDSCRFVVSNRRLGFFLAALIAIFTLRLVYITIEKQADLQGLKQPILTNTIEAEAIPRPVSRFLPPTSFRDPPLPPGHPCRGFTLPPPPADKKRTGPRPCPVCYLPVEDAMKLHPPPGVFPDLVLKDLKYFHGRGAGKAGSDFGGHPTMEDRGASYKIKEAMQVHCGFAQGSKPGAGSGFDLDERDLRDMEKCKDIVVVSAIFANYDPMQQPKNISDASKRDVCFFMFVDEETEAAIEKDDVYKLTRKVGLWRIVTIKNLPYSDARRTGKIPKLLPHRLFPNARFSLWVDGKLELVVDPYQILERFLWRTNDTYAISKHYKRFDVFTEAEANKAAGKYNNASIDAQINVYRSEGLQPYSSFKLPIVSDVPEGCVIIREHTPVTNLFSCLWFNEVDRFTSRDQLSFGIVRDKIMAQIPWRINMFLDCERRNFVVQGYHRDVLLQRRSPPPPPVTPVRPRLNNRGSRKTRGKKRDVAS